jgi:hypothetical protein
MGNLSDDLLIAQVNAAFALSQIHSPTLRQLFLDDPWIQHRRACFPVSILFLAIFDIEGYELP